MKKVKLGKYEKKLLRLCKGKHQFKKGLRDFDLLAKYYYQVYGLNPSDYPNEFKQCMFINMYSLLMKVTDGDKEKQTINVFNASFYEGFNRTQKEPIARAICELYGLLQCVIVRKEINGRYRWRFDMY